ncbi:hemin uptake protein HemP [Martelella sp. HB161492]|uniref:hemin uptake protein HemP n=1 Tax=Martelella sp. HB161492 TaxID=2720726 RepID=UPI001591E3C4|nr:hemin uptake protein HemP [Martelella sp. HB161492]
MNENKTVTMPPENSVGTRRVIESTALFGRDSEIIIRHQGADYHMKITRQGKLILNK